MITKFTKKPQRISFWGSSSYNWTQRLVKQILHVCSVMIWFSGGWHVGLNMQSCFTSSPVSTERGGHIQVDKPSRYVTNPPGSIQPSHPFMGRHT